MFARGMPLAFENLVTVVVTMTGLFSSRLRLKCKNGWGHCRSLENRCVRLSVMAGLFRGADHVDHDHCIIFLGRGGLGFLLLLLTCAAWALAAAS